MNFIEALRECLNGRTFLSCAGGIYTSVNLNVKKLSETVYVCDSVNSERERKGRWEVFPFDDEFLNGTKDLTDKYDDTLRNLSNK